jgi:hypothetical protein
MESSSFLRMSASHVLTALGSFVFGMICASLIGADDDLSISAAVGLGFGQLSMLAVWCVAGISRTRFWSSAAAVLSCYIAMSLWAVMLGQHLDGAFFLSLAIFSVLYFLAMAAVMLLVRKVRRVSVVRLVDIQEVDGFTGQYGIRDIMIVMSIAAIGIAGIKFLSSQVHRDLLEMFTIFALITISFFLISWPIVVTCLSKRWVLLVAFSSFLIAAIFLLQPPVFGSVLGPGGDANFFIFLDIPFVLSVALHSLIARWFGYRLTTVAKA